jgi:hypothetical protein
MKLNTITVGNHDFASISVEDFIKLNPIPTNRDSQRRVSKMKQVFDDAYLENQTNTLTEVAIAIVDEDFEDKASNTKYFKDDIYIVDGNTRKFYWLAYPERRNNIGNITAKIHYLRSMKDVHYAYYPYNNQKSVEKASEILQGLRGRYNWNPRQQMFNNGSYKTALDWAAYTPGDDAPDVFQAFNICFEALKIIDGIPHGSENTITKPYLDGLKSQSIIGACLLALRFNPNNLRVHDLIARLSTMNMDELNKAIAHGELDAVQIIAAEYSGQSSRRNKNADAEPWLNGLARSTNHASKPVQMDFLIYWIERYIENPKKTWNFNKGIRPEYWQGAWENYFPTEE